MANYCVMRTDSMHGTTDGQSLVNVKIPADLENGVVVVVGTAGTDRDTFNCTVATGSAALNKCAILCGPEVMYDERKKNLSDYINTVADNGGVYRAYRFFDGDMFGITKEGFTADPAASDVGSAVALGANGKFEVGGNGTKVGTIIAYEAPYFVIREVV